MHEDAQHHGRLEALKHSAEQFSQTITDSVNDCPYRSTALSYVRDALALCETALVVEARSSQR